MIKIHINVGLEGLNEITGNAVKAPQFFYLKYEMLLIFKANSICMRYKYLVASALQEELDEFLKRVNPNTKPLDLDVSLTSHKHSDKTIEVLTFSANRMGMPYNAAKLMQIIMTFQPKYVLFIGICAGLKDHPLGSVLVPQKVFSYESGKLNNGRFLPDYTSYHTSDIFRKRAQSLQNKDFNSFGYEVITDEEFSSGSAVINDEAKVKEIQEGGARKLSGLEMEAYSIACINEILNPNCQALVIKGISDKAVNKDSSEVDGSREKAKKNAADFALRLINYIEENESTSTLDELLIQCDIVEDANAVFKLKMNLRVTNKSSYPVSLESIDFSFFDPGVLDPIARSSHRKPMFLIGKDFGGKDIYKDFCLLQPGERPLACWIPLNPSLGKQKLDELHVKRRIGKWELKHHSLNRIPYSGNISI